MKRTHLISLLFAMFFLPLSAAETPTIVETTPSKKTVVLEEYTGIGCQFCPLGHLAENKMLEKYPKSVLINIHQGGFATGVIPLLTTPFGDALFQQTGASDYPTGTLNRQVISPSKVTAVSNYNKFPTYAETIVAQDAYLNVAASTSIDWHTREMKVYVEVYYTGDSPKDVNFLNVALLQSNIMGPQAGMTANPDQIIDEQYQHNHALRYLLTGQWGDSVKTTQTGNFFSNTYTYTLPKELKNVPLLIEDLEVAVFVTETRQEIINGTRSPISYVNQPALYAGIFKGGQIEHASCDDLVNGYVWVDNKGTDTIESITFNLTSSSQKAEYTSILAKPLVPGAKDSISLMPLNTIVGTNRNYTVETIAINGTNLDSIYTSSYTFNVLKYFTNATGNLNLKLVYDRYGSEVNWDVMELGGSILAKGGPYEDLDANGTKEVKANITTAKGCYIFEIRDDAGDGINNGRGAGYYEISDGAGAVIAESNGKYRSGEKRYFAMNGYVDLEDTDLKSENNLSIYPSPATSHLYLRSPESIKEVSIFNVNGQKVLDKKSLGTEARLDVSSFQNGIYIVRVRTEKGIMTQKFVVNK